MQLPPQIRDGDPKLKFNPHYRMAGQDYVAQVGPRCFSISRVQNYESWNSFSAATYSAFEKFNSLKIAEPASRIGVRYISFFENVNIFDHVMLDFSVAGQSMANAENIIRSIFDIDGYKCVLQITNAADTKGKKGSVIDIDIITIPGASIDDSTYRLLIEGAHNLEKKIFFGLLKPEFVKGFNPKYDPT